MAIKSFAPALLVLASLMVSACGTAQDSTGEKSGWAGIADKARAEVRKEMATQDLDIGKETEGLPRAALSPQGDLLIGGEKVAITPAQRALLLGYRSQLAGVAEAGADVGLQAAELATNAMKEAAKAAFSGDKAGMEARMKTQSAAIELAAQGLCDRLPALLASQRAAAEAIPELRPYATMDDKDIQDCNVDHQANVPAANEAAAEGAGN